MSKESEYMALRDEMMKQFDRIHDTMKYGLGVFIALIAYYHASTPDKISSGIAICLFQLLVFSIGIIILRNYQGIYLEGTHIAVCHENAIEFPWHRMSRRYGDFTKEKFPFPFGSRWGADSTVFSYILFIAGTVAWIEILTQNQITYIDMKSMLPLFIFAGVITLANAFILYKLVFGIKKYREEIEIKWKLYSAKGKATYTDFYSTAGSATTAKNGETKP